MASSWFPKGEAGGLSQKQSAETCPKGTHVGFTSVCVGGSSH